MSSKWLARPQVLNKPGTTREKKEPILFFFYYTFLNVERLLLPTSWNTTGHNSLWLSVFDYSSTCSIFLSLRSWWSGSLLWKKKKQTKNWKKKKKKTSGRGHNLSPFTYSVYQQELHQHLSAISCVSLLRNKLNGTRRIPFMNEMRNRKTNFRRSHRHLNEIDIVRNKFEKMKMWNFVILCRKKKKTNHLQSISIRHDVDLFQTCFFLQLSFIGIEIKINSTRNQIKSGCKKKKNNHLTILLTASVLNSKWRYYYQRSKKREKQQKSNPI